MKVWAKSIMGGCVLTALDWVLMSRFPAVQTHGPLATLHAVLFGVLMSVGMNPHAPTLPYGLLGILILFLFFSLLSLLVLSTVSMFHKTE
jgi:hypothetical protein